MNSTERQRLIRHFSELIAEALNATDNAARERLLAEAQAIIEQLDQQQCADPGSRHSAACSIRICSSSLVPRVPAPAPPQE